MKDDKAKYLKLYPTQGRPRRLLKPARTLSSTAKNPRKSMWPVSSTDTRVSGTPMALAKALVVISWQAPKENSKISTSAHETQPSTLKIRKGEK